MVKLRVLQTNGFVYELQNVSRFELNINAGLHEPIIAIDSKNNIGEANFDTIPISHIKSIEFIK